MANCRGYAQRRRGGQRVSLLKLSNILPAGAEWFGRSPNVAEGQISSVGISFDETSLGYVDEPLRLILKQRFALQGEVAV